MENNADKYATWPGCSKKDNAYCMSCIWHSELEGRYICCDYSLEETHRIRDCRAGVGCKYRETGKKNRGIRVKKSRRNMATCRAAEFDALVMIIGRKRMMELTGYSRTGLDGTKERGRIRIRSAQRLYDETGIDITGGELRNGI